MLTFWQEFTRTEKSNSVLRPYLKFYTKIPLSHTEYNEGIVFRKNGKEKQMQHYKTYITCLTVKHNNCRAKSNVKDRNFYFAKLDFEIAISIACRLE